VKNGYQDFFKAAGRVAKGKSEKQVKPASSDAVEQKLRAHFKVRERRKNPFPWSAVVGLVVLASGLVLYLKYPQTMETWISRIEIQPLGRVQASDAPAKPKSAESSPAAANPHPESGGSSSQSVSEDMSHFKKLGARKEELDRREQSLVQLEEELQKQKEDLDRRLQQLEQMRAEIAKILKDRVEVDQEKVGRLVELYSNMKPKQAAEVISSINEDLAVEVLTRMKKKNAAEIMNLLPPDKSKVLSERFTGYRRSPASAAAAPSADPGKGTH
jgi:flagellar motility protein MotE (MotC chaperone)